MNFTYIDDNTLISFKQMLEEIIKEDIDAEIKEIGTRQLTLVEEEIKKRNLNSNKHISSENKDKAKDLLESIIGSSNYSTGGRSSSGFALPYPTGKVIIGASAFGLFIYAVWKIISVGLVASGSIFTIPAMFVSDVITKKILNKKYTNNSSYIANISDYMDDKWFILNLIILFIACFYNFYAILVMGCISPHDVPNIMIFVKMFGSTIISIITNIIISTKTMIKKYGKKDKENNKKSNNKKTTKNNDKSKRKESINTKKVIKNLSIGVISASLAYNMLPVCPYAELRISGDTHQEAMQRLEEIVENYNYEKYHITGVERIAKDFYINSINLFNNEVELIESIVPVNKEINYEEVYLNPVYYYFNTQYQSLLNNNFDINSYEYKRYYQETINFIYGGNINIDGYQYNIYNTPSDVLRNVFLIQDVLLLNAQKQSYEDSTYIQNVRDYLNVLKNDLCNYKDQSFIKRLRRNS